MLVAGAVTSMSGIWFILQLAIILCDKYLLTKHYLNHLHFFYIISFLFRMSAYIRP